MRARRLVPLIVVIAGTAAAFAILLAGSEPEPPATNGTAADVAVPASEVALPARVVTAGAVTVSIEPIRIDDTGAAFQVSMETHSEELSADLERTAILEVGGVSWTSAAWTGDPPAGHHRAGELTFAASGEAAGPVTLSIGGFSEPVEVTWHSVSGDEARDLG
jgi:hypothetical protein